MCEWVNWLSIILTYLLQTVEVRVIPLLLSRGGFLVINNKIDKKKSTFKLNMDVKGSIDQWEFKRVYNSVVKIDM